MHIDIKCFNPICRLQDASNTGFDADPFKDTSLINDLSGDPFAGEDPFASEGNSPYDDTFFETYSSLFLPADVISVSIYQKTHSLDPLVVRVLSPTILPGILSALHLIKVAFLNHLVTHLTHSEPSRYHLLV